MICKFIEIKDMAASRAILMNNMRSLNKTIVEHFAKCAAMKQSIDFNHWKKEILTCINRIYNVKLKQSNKLPEKEFIYENLFCDSFDEPRDIILIYLELEKNYPNIPEEIFEEENIWTNIGIKYLSFSKDCSQMMSEENHTISDFENLLNQYI